MIGGIDVQIPTRCGPPLSTEVAVRAIRQRWLDAEYENGATGERYSRFRLIPFGEIEEIFVYRDRHSADRWDTEGAIPGLRNTMIHIVAEMDLITVVVDLLDAVMDEIIAAIRSALGDDIFYLPAELVAA
jgi:hypothetical protein